MAFPPPSLLASIYLLALEIIRESNDSKPQRQAYRRSLFVQNWKERKILGIDMQDDDYEGRPKEQNAFDFSLNCIIQKKKG